MVYESDFYTTRRTRPTVSSYSVTVPPRYVFRRSMSPVPSYTTYAMPRFTRAHSPVVISVPVVPTKYGRNAAYIAEMNRIGHRMRPRVGSEPCEDFLNSDAITTFDDETRAIRARTNELLRRVNQPLPRSYYPDYSPPRYEIESSPEPLSHEDYIEQRVFTPMRHVHQDISTISRFNEPARQYIGKGHLACISFAGGRPMDRRRPILIGAMPRCEEDRNVRDDIKFLSHYNRARAAALGPGASLDAIKALMAPPYHRRDPQPDLMVMPYSRPRAPAAFIFRMEAAEREKCPQKTEKKTYREIKPYVTTKSKELSRVRAASERDAELGRTAFAESQQAMKNRVVDDPDELERIARKKQREMEMEEAAQREVEQKRAEREAAKRQAELERQQELEREEQERIEAELAERKRQADLERKAEQARRAEEERLEALEAERQAQLEREEEERRAEEERLAQEAEAEQARIAAARKAEEERQEAERKAEEERLEAERKAEEERLEAERKAEEERIAAEKKAEEERLAAEKAEEERLAAEKKAEEERLAAEAAAAEAAAAEAAAAEAAAAEAEAAAPEETPAVEAEVAAEDAAPAESEPAQEEPAEEPAEEPVVEEPQSPADEEKEAPMTNGSAVNGTEVNGTAIEELEIPLEDETPEMVVKKVQEVSQEADAVEA